MKSILISIKPKYVAKILNGVKTIEIRKTIPKCDLPIDVYIYCTKDLKSAKQVLTWLNEKSLKQVKNITYQGKELLGKVVAKFTLDKVEEIEPFEEYDSPMGLAYRFTEKKVGTCWKAQLTYDEFNHYLKGKTGYAIHISQLEIFDKPKELSEFDLKRPPQSWCYVN